VTQTDIFRLILKDKYLFRWSVLIQSVSKKAVFHLVVQFLVVLYLQKNVQVYVECTDGQILSLATATDRWQLFKSLWTSKCAGQNLDLEDL
jgi:hypothetical protein